MGIKSLVFNALGRDCWDGPCPGVILVERAGLLAGLFIARWAGQSFHTTPRHGYMSKFVNTLTPIYIRAWPVYTKLH